jgi:hypothetical protein
MNQPCQTSLHNFVNGSCEFVNSKNPFLRSGKKGFPYEKTIRLFLDELRFSTFR